MKLQVRFGDVPSSATPAASALILAASGITERVTPTGTNITNSHYEGDWDAEIDSETKELVANWVCRIWRGSRILDME